MHAYNLSILCSDVGISGKSEKSTETVYPRVLYISDLAFCIGVIIHPDSLVNCSSAKKIFFFKVYGAV